MSRRNKQLDSSDDDDFYKEGCPVNATRKKMAMSSDDDLATAGVAAQAPDMSKAESSDEEDSEDESLALYVKRKMADRKKFSDESKKGKSASGQGVQRRVISSSEDESSADDESFTQTGGSSRFPLVKAKPKASQKKPTLPSAPMGAASNAPAALPVKDLSLAPELRPRVFYLNDPVDFLEAQTFYGTYGYVLVNPFKSEEERRDFCERTVKEVWNNLMNSVGYKPELLAKAPMINTKEDLEKFMGVLPQDIKKHMKKVFGDHHWFHQGFGASCYNSSFNAKVSWEMRMNHLLASFAGTLMREGDDVHFSIDRTISKWLKQGEHEFMHVDTPPFSGEHTDSVNGKFCATEGGFICAPGSHKLVASVKDLYSPLYGKPKPLQTKFALKKDRADPLQFFENARKVIVPAGSLILWHTDTFHGVVKNGQERVQWGFYLGFLNDIGRDLYRETTGVHERDDRYNSWRLGTRPKAHPSCDPSKLYPERFKNFHGILEGFINKKMDRDDPRFDFSRRWTKGSITDPPKLVADLKELRDEAYKPPPLTLRGRQMLVGIDYVDHYPWDFE